MSSLGTVLEELFAGFLLEPVCTLSRQGLLHLRHVLLRLQWETERDRYTLESGFQTCPDTHRLRNETVEQGNADPVTSSWSWSNRHWEQRKLQPPLG